MPTNERLRGSIAAAGLDLPTVADAAGVDAKTVERWITKGRTPHRRHRDVVSKALAVEDTYLWPALMSDAKTQAASVAELLELHPSRSAVPYEVWQQLIKGTREAFEVLMYAATFLFEQHDLGSVIRQKSQEGVRVRILIADEASDAVRRRSEEEGTTGGLQARIQLHRRYLNEVVDLPGVEVRTHGTTLYNSLFRFDQDLLVNGHAYGSLAGQNPVMHLRRVPGGRMWDHYMRSFDEVWNLGTPQAPVPHPRTAG